MSKNNLLCQYGQSIASETSPSRKLSLLFARFYPLIFRFSNSENRVKAMLEALTRKYAQDSVEDYL